MRRHGTGTGRLLLGCVLLLALPATALGQVLFSCVRPLVVQDRWEEVQTPPWDLTDTFDVWLSGEPLPNPDRYRPPFDPSPTGYDHTIHGVALVFGLGSAGGALRGDQWLPVEWASDGCLGGDCYRDRIVTCHDYPVAPGDVLAPMPGNMAGPTVQALRDLIARDPSAYWDPDLDGGHGGIVSPLTVSPRLVTVPLFDPNWFVYQRDLGGRFESRVVGFAGFFVTAAASWGTSGYLVSRFHARPDGAVGVYGGAVELAAEVRVGMSPISGLDVEFLVDGTAVGTALTDAASRAVLRDVSLAGVPAGLHTLTVRVLTNLGPLMFIGDEATLTVTRAVPAIAWAPPSPLLYGTALGPAQLNATADLPGTFTYTPPAGTLLPLGLGQALSATFTPVDVENAEAVTVTRTLDVVAPAFSVTLPAKPVAGCLPTTGRIVLAYPAPAGGYAFRLSSTHPAVFLPATVTVPAGVTSKSFRILTSPVASLTAVDVRATWREVQNVTANLQVRPIGPKRVDLTPNPVVGGHEVLGTVTMECPAGPGDIPVTLSSTRPGTAAPSLSLLFMPAGSLTGSFAVMTAPPPTTVRVSIKARANDLTKAKALTVTP